MPALTGFLCAFAPLRLCVESVPGHVAVNLIRPRGDAAFDALEIFEALLPQEVQRLQRTHAGFGLSRRISLEGWQKLAGG